jgi:hypothetical protein
MRAPDWSMTRMSCCRLVPLDGDSEAGLARMGLQLPSAAALSL